MALPSFEVLHPVNDQEWKRSFNLESDRSGEAGSVDPFLRKILASGRLTVVDHATLESQPRQELAASLGLEMNVGLETAYVLMVRHESGAISYHFPTKVERGVVEGRAVPATLRFSVRIPALVEPAQPERPPLASKIVHATALKVTGTFADVLTTEAGRRIEAEAWELLGLDEGWKSVSPSTLHASPLPIVKIADAVSTTPQDRNLLLLHGTFSNAHAAFADLASTLGSNGKTFFESVQPIYGDRVFAFDHFTVSRSLAENAQMLLDELPDRECLFDVVTHSRGGLVLRTLVENRSTLRSASRFQLGRAVLVASPNEGTPLASPSRLDSYITWMSNVIDMFPDNPLTTAARFIAEALAWIAHAARVDLPGLAAMNSEGPVIQQLNSMPGTAANAYSALVSNYAAPGLIQRIIDAGIDAFFNTPNDLVVPTEGGWHIATVAVNGQSIGCYGQGGNLKDPREGLVNHVCFFSRSETVDFLTRTLLGEPSGLLSLDPEKHLPFRSPQALLELADNH